MQVYNKKYYLAVSAIFVSVLLSACATSPTGRNQILLFTESQLANSGSQAFAAMKTQQKISSKRVTNNYVQCITSAITKQVSEDIFSGDWEVVVFDDPAANAFALPGGKIGVYTGLLEIADSQAQVASVIGHEVGHVIAQHGNERMSQSQLIGIGQQVVNQVLATNEVAGSQAIMSALGLGIQVGISLPYSRIHESEADLIGLDLMARAGFDPRESVKLWENMSKNEGGSRQPEFLSTHPAPQTRIEQLQSNMDSAMTIYQAAANKPKC
ncbi:M48 family metallopeptidase [Agaribacter flavus]|uniref:M48 family metallopeptidase n=1 Tax=Agaribacter flavus TaxID=1902781 RepID=A0ABV7FL03_9ALTE